MSSPDTPTFHNFDASHIVILLLTFAVPVLLAWVARKSKSGDAGRVISNALALLLIGNYLAQMGCLYAADPRNIVRFLPMQLCDWALFATAAALVTRNAYCFELAYFWGLGGTLQAVITPNLHCGFPTFTFISFFITHSGIVIAILFMLLAVGMRPRSASVIRVLLWSEVYLGVALAVNCLTGGNYGFLSHKPEGASLLDLMSHSRPVYIVEINCAAVVIIVCLYVPFLLYDGICARRMAAVRAPLIRKEQ